VNSASSSFRIRHGFLAIGAGSLRVATQSGVIELENTMTRYLLLLGFSACAFAASAGEDVTFQTVDANKDGFVSESEFVSWKTSTGEMSPADALIKFIEIDADASGMISEAEMDAAKARKSEENSESDKQM
jgi:hypothetical protein